MSPTSTSFEAVNTRHPSLNVVVLPRPWPLWLLLTMLALVVAAPASTKVAGAAWLLVVLAGLWATLRIPVAHPPGHPLVQSSRLWLIACLVAILLQAFATWYWVDPWGDLHVEIRLLLGAGATFSLVRRLRFLTHQKIWLIYALSVACWIALGVTYLNGRATPSNPIPWAAGVSFLVCLLLPWVLQPQVLRWQRIAWGVSVMAGMSAVLLSLSRGSYGLMLWILGVAGVAAVQKLRKCSCDKDGDGLRSAVPWLVGVAVAFTLLAVLLVSFPHSYEASAGRVQEAWHEIEGMNKPELPQVQAINTSVGARLHMWRMAVDEIGEAPFLGHGRKARIEWIHQLGQTDGSAVIKTLEHLHSDPLTILFDHGLLGFTSYLILGIGLAWIGLGRHQNNKSLRLTLAGILWMHLTSGLTNTNFGHNYYGVMLALSLSLAWLLSASETTERQVLDGRSQDH
jgi:O-antigen ligase